MKTALFVLLLSLTCMGFDSNTITYLFNGHSNMKYCLSTGGDTIFLESMSAFYPDKKFKILDGSHLSCPLSDMGNGGPYLDKFKQRISEAKDSTMIGGCFLMFGFLDGRTDVEAKSFLTNMVHFISEVRQSANNPELPIFVCRYEKNVTATEAQHYRMYWQIIDASINKLPELLSHVYLFPLIEIPEKRFKINDHHNDPIGYKIIVQQWPSIIQIYNEDFWR